MTTTTEATTMHWYVVQTYSGFEKSVQRTLQEHIKRAGMENMFGEIMVPTEEVVEMKSGQKRTSERKFFPGYVLVKMEMTDETWHLVTNAILHQVQEGVEKPRPKFSFEPGEMVRIKEGPFADFNGTVEDVNFEKSKLRVNVSIFGRLTPVELDFGQVEKA
mgnify:CR=1 FL=1